MDCGNQDNARFPILMPRGTARVALFGTRTKANNPRNLPDYFLLLPPIFIFFILAVLPPYTSILIYSYNDNAQLN